MLYGLVLAVHLVACFVLILVILLQAGRGGGLSDSFGGGAAQSLFGTRGTVYLTRATTIFAATFMVTSLTLAILSVQKGRSLMEATTVSRSPVTTTKQAAAPEVKPVEPKPAQEKPATPEKPPPSQ
ncbi:MAG: preprotein translocase subunit SecG [Candidatus Omnitrophica bacterium]|nr:preprotein translocase subunit SecG [Candidatus Omnitrophota bacterium]